MSANLEAKKIAVEGIKELINSSKSIVLLDYRGISVSKDTSLRKEMRNNNITYKVIKNTLFKKACEELNIDISSINEQLNGTTAFAFGVEDETAAPRMVKSQSKEYSSLVIKAGLYNSKAISKQEVEVLASIPSKETLVAQLLYVLNAPVSSLARAFKAIAEKN